MITEPASGTSRESLVTASAFKIWLSKVVDSEKAGQVIGAITRKHIRHYGLWFDTSSENFSPRVRAQMFWGGYEGAETRFVRRFLGGSTAVVELGSSLGITASHIATAMKPEGRLVCVEANPRLIPGLRDTLTRHAGKLRVDVIHAAVAPECGTTALTIGGETYGSHTQDRLRPGETRVQVPALTLREILRHADVTTFDLVSDIEGAEVSFLVQDPDVLRNCRTVVIELHETNLNNQPISVFDLLDAAVAHGFQITARHGPVVALTRA